MNIIANTVEPNTCKHVYKYHESTFGGSLFKFIECIKCSNRQYL